VDLFCSDNGSCCRILWSIRFEYRTARNDFYDCLYTIIYTGLLDDRYNGISEISKHRAGIMAAAGLLRGVFGTNYTAVLITTIALAVYQLFLMNSISTVAAKWFPIEERATASGLTLVANFLGIARLDRFCPPFCFCVLELLTCCSFMVDFQFLQPWSS